MSRDAMHWARHATTRSALLNVIAGYQRRDARFERVVDAHLKAGRLCWDDGVLKVGQSNTTHHITTPSGHTHHL
ncbi:hypothetical protein GCM10009007_20590 [Formosimonas limnophila]|uniref:Uncharacterized protein n=1 Tax=Formosimonas limnophila TaxID=1384487 RepID=A0A8J3FZ82_9BURK|nr:hypothetical protein [Formosimonas limnophila]GHA79483.1 hypothetical protein GCM10009007_20590 [Formosimonas limnophila]